MEDYLKYQEYICDIPEFLYKYLNIDIMNRLKNISVLCGMDYASPYMYDFGFYLSRYNHSLNVALLTWKLTKDKTQTLAALFHDISTPVFSHVIDYMNGDYINQETTEDKTKEVLLSSKELISYLIEDNININDIINFKKYSIVDLPRPYLCADRLENIIGVGMCWAKKVTLNNAKVVLDSIYLERNENNRREIATNSQYVGEYLKYINDEINLLTHTDEDTYMMLLLADIVKVLLNENIIIYDDLFILTEPEIISIIENNLYIHELNDLYNTFKTIKKLDNKKDIKIKNLTLNPLILGKRLY